MSMQKRPDSERLQRALDMIVGGKPYTVAAREVGLTSQTVHYGWLRWIVLPQWKELREGISLDKALHLENAQLAADNAVLRKQIAQLLQEQKSLSVTNTDLEKKLDAALQDAHELSLELADSLMSVDKLEKELEGIE